MGKPGSPQLDPWLTPQDIADRYQVPLATIYKWNSEGTGPRRRTFGRHVRYRFADVLRWEEDQEPGGRAGSDIGGRSGGSR